MLHEIVRGNEIVVINDDAGMGKDGGGRAGLESNELKAKRSGPVCILTLLNQYVNYFLCIQKEEKKRKIKKSRFRGLLGLLALRVQILS